MRCRYCKKAISLLRRLNDAEFCSDAHRYSFDEEQQLAMKILSANQSAGSRLQRVSRDETEARLAFGNYVPVAQAPSVARRACGEIAMEWSPQPPVILADREYSFRSGFFPSTRMVAVQQEVAEGVVPKALVAGLLFRRRPSLPPPVTNPSRGVRGWYGKCAVDLEQVTVHPARTPIRSARGRQLQPIGTPNWRMRRRQHREHAPARVEDLTPVALLASKPAGGGVTTGLAWRASNLVGWPASGLRAVQTVSPARAEQTELPEEYWTQFSESPLCGPQSSAGYTRVLAAAPHVPAPQSTPVAAPPTGKPIPPWASHAVLVTGPRVRRKLRPVSAPDAGKPRILPPLYEAKFIANRHGTVKPAEAVRAIAAQGKLAQWHRLQPLQRLASADVRAVFDRAYWPFAPETAGIARRATPLALIKQLRTARNPVAVSPPPPAAVKPARREAESIGPSITCGKSIDDARIHSLRPAQRVAALGGRVAYRFTVSPADYALRPTVAGAVATEGGIWLPQGTMPGRRPWASAGLVLLHAPQMAGTQGQRQPQPDLPPAAAVRRPRVAWTLEQRTPGKLPVTLFAVPNARPVAQREAIRPRLFSIGLWAGKPAICPVRIGFDDGRSRRSSSARELGNRFRRVFSKSGARAAYDRLGHLPSDLKWIAIVVPLVIGIWVLARPTSEAAPATTAVQRSEPVVAPVEPVESNSPVAVAAVSAPAPVAETKPALQLPPDTTSRWDILTAKISSRASVNLVEDFQNGLSRWEGRGDWARSWFYDRAGAVRPGNLAIFQPTVPLRDYVMEMKASIEKRAIQWVVRASGPQNYHFSRLNVTPGAPLTKLEFERWTVVNGRQGRVTRLPLPHGGANQTLYSIRVDVKGDSVTTYLQDQVIDTFSDPRLQEGGVGLMGNTDDRAKVYGIHVFHQNDFLGKLCSFLAPVPIHTQGSD